METKFISIGDTNVEYPVGEYMRLNKPHMVKLSNAILQTFPNTNLTLWVRGSSGALLAGVISALATVDVKVVYVYKEEEHSHNVHDFTNPIKDSKNLIVDDFTCTFKTIIKILDYMDDCGVVPDGLCTFGTINGENMCKRGYADKFPVIICSKIWWKNRSITNSGNYNVALWHSKCVEEISVSENQTP